MTSAIARVAFVLMGFVAGSLSTFIVMRLVFTPAPLPPAPPPVVQVAEAVEAPPVAPEPAAPPPVEEPPVAPEPAAPSPVKVSPPRPEVAPTPPAAPPAMGSLAVLATSTGETSPAIFVDNVERRAGRYRGELPAGDHTVKIVCPKDSPNPGWAPVKTLAVMDGQEVGLRVDCDIKAITRL